MSGNYPQTVVEILDPELLFPPNVLQAVARFAASGPWRGTQEERKQKFRDLNRALSDAQRLPEPDLTFGQLDGFFSGQSRYLPAQRRIVLSGKLSVVTFLHEFAHALGMDEREACRWSVNLFRKSFPIQFGRLVQVGHTLIRAADVPRSSTRTP